MARREYSDGHVIRWVAITIVLIIIIIIPFGVNTLNSKQTRVAILNRCAVVADTWCAFYDYFIF